MKLIVDNLIQVKVLYAPINSNAPNYSNWSIVLHSYRNMSGHKVR